MVEWPSWRTLDLSPLVIYGGRVTATERTSVGRIPMRSLSTASTGLGVKRLPKNTQKRRRRVVKRRNPTNPISFVENFVSRDPFPPSMRRKLNYCIGVTLGTAATQYQCGTENVWRLASLFDPDQTGGAHQPYGYDQMTPLYARYKVWAVTMDFTAVLKPTVADAIGLVVLAKGSSSAFSLTGVSFTDAIEKTAAHPIYTKLYEPTRYRQRFSIQQVEGLTSQQFGANVEEYAAAVGANPGRNPLITVAAACLSSSSATNLDLVVRLEYECEFFDRTVLSAS